MKKLIVILVVLAVIAVMALRGCPRVRRSFGAADKPVKVGATLVSVSTFYSCDMNTPNESGNCCWGVLL